MRERMVKFGKLLQEDIDKYHEWVPSDKYLDYERLKDIIYDRIEVKHTRRECECASSEEEEGACASPHHKLDELLCL